MDAKTVARDTAKVLQSYLTYQAVRTIINQLGETNPGQAIWLRQYSDKNKIQDGEAYLQGLMSEDKELVLRIMIVREHLGDRVLEFLPEMVSTGIQQANLELRRGLLERLTQTADPENLPKADNSNSELDVNDTPR